jgi:hypothetical protein
MAKYRNVSPAAVEVYCNAHPRGGPMGIVEPDGILEVDDEVARAHSWPESIWSEVNAPKKETAKKKDNN